jgi:hypothetical protein
VFCRYIHNELNVKNCIIQSDFEGCADILTCDRTPQKVTIEPTMSYSNDDKYFSRKRAKFFQKKFGGH